MRQFCWLVAGCLALGACAVGIRSSEDNTEAEAPLSDGSGGPTYDPDSSCGLNNSELEQQLQGAKDDETVPENGVPCGAFGIESGVGVAREYGRRDALIQTIKRLCDKRRICAAAPNDNCGNARLNTAEQLRQSINEGDVEQDTPACGDDGAESGVGVDPDAQLGFSPWDTVAEMFQSFCDSERRACE